MDNGSFDHYFPGEDDLISLCDTLKNSIFRLDSNVKTERGETVFLHINARFEVYACIFVPQISKFHQISISVHSEFNICNNVDCRSNTRKPSHNLLKCCIPIQNFFHALRNNSTRFYFDFGMLDDPEGFITTFCKDTCVASSWTHSYSFN